MWCSHDCTARMVHMDEIELGSSGVRKKIWLLSSGFMLWIRNSVLFFPSNHIAVDSISARLLLYWSRRTRERCDTRSTSISFWSQSETTWNRTCLITVIPNRPLSCRQHATTELKKQRHRCQKPADRPADAQEAQQWGFWHALPYCPDDLTVLMTTIST